MSLFHKNTLLGASGAGGAAEALYVDDVFSTFLYDGTGSSLSINNGIDLDGEGGLVWIKCRNSFAGHFLYDTERGRAYALKSHNNDPQDGPSSAGRDFSSFDNDGFTLGQNQYHSINNSGDEFVSWTFRKAPGFFDVVTWTGNGVSGRQIAHNLGSAPGFIMIKSYVQGTGGTGWWCFHRSIGNTKAIRLDSTGAATSASSTYWNNTSPTSTHFTVGNHEDINGSGDGRSYVAYVFAHDDQSFGDDSDEAIIKCGSYTNNASQAVEVDLGFEPQWVMVKITSGGGDWVITDTIRGAAVVQSDTGGGTGPSLAANSTNAESPTGSVIKPTSTGFKLQYNVDASQNSGATTGTVDYIYIAIRRPHKPPTAATEVFAVAAAGGFSDVTSNFPVDAAFQFRRSAGSKAVLSRLTGKNFLEARNNSAETSGALGWYESNTKYLNSGLFSANSAFYLFKRAPGFMDVVTYTGTGLTRTVNHNLGVAPELIILKNRTGSSDSWGADLVGSNVSGFLNAASTFSSGLLWNNGVSSTSVGTTYTGSIINNFNTPNEYVLFLFATLAGISKVGTYSGTGNNVDVDCGFSAGARFVLIKRTDSTGDWYFYDTARGIASGNDPYIANPAGSSTDEVTNTDYIDPLNSGFTVTSSAPAALNASGGTYIFLAIA